MGDPACWMANVCPACGRFLEETFAEEGCPYCGAPAPAQETLVEDAGDRPPTES